MKEKIVHFLWKHKLFNASSLISSCGKEIEIIKVGTHNQDKGGPDFLNASIKIGDTHWFGHVEIHLKSSDWIAHQHQFDPAYDSVILHVVWDSDKIIYNKKSVPLPELCISSYVDQNVLRYIRDFQSNKEIIACGSLVKDVPYLTKKMFYDRLVVSRIQRKTNQLKQDYIQLNKNWERLCLLAISRVLGLTHNVESFENLVKSIPLDVIQKNRDSSVALEAMVFGQSGFFENEYEDKYAHALKEKYSFLQKKYKFSSLNYSQWQWFRIRPASFPSIRLAQFSSFLFHRSSCFSQLMEMNSKNEIEEFFTFPVSKYWQNHYHFDRLSKKSSHQLSKEWIDKIVINAIVPLFFLRAELYSDMTLMEKGLCFLENTLAEKNIIQRKWKDVAVDSRNAFESQALTELYKEFCSQKKCLNCSIGFAILKNCSKNG